MRGSRVAYLLSCVELLLALLQLGLGAFLVYCIEHRALGSPHGQLAFNMLLGSAIVGQAVQFVQWFILSKADLLSFTAYTLMLLTAFLEPMLVAAITITLALYGIVHHAEAVAQSRNYME